MKPYVLQFQKFQWSKWETLLPGYDTLDEAEAAFERQPIKTGWRIAEAYTVTRYKPVKL